MKQIIIALFSIAMVFAGDKPEDCRPQNLPKGASFIDCCQMKVEMFSPQNLEQCLAKFPMLPKGEKSPNPMEQICCAAECVAKETKTFVDGKFDKTALINQLSSKDASLKSTAETAVNYCMEKVEKMPRPPFNTSCSHIPKYMTGCIHAQLYKACDSKIVADKAECADLSKFAAKCDWVPPVDMKGLKKEE